MFLVPPVVVLIHELGHVAAVLAVGARVTGFHYGVFEGAVGFVGDITPGQGWFVALAGNVFGALTGLALAGVGMAGPRLRPGLRYLLILGGTLQVGYALVGYPVLSLSSNWGDWVAIYDFGATPALSWATAVGPRGRCWSACGGGGGGRCATPCSRSDRARATGWRRCGGRCGTPPPTSGRGSTWPGCTPARGELGLARDTLDEAAGAGAAPTARIHLARARVAIMESRWSAAVMAAEEGVKAAGPDDVEVVQRLWANQGLALASMERPTHALAAFDRVQSPVVDDARVRYGRGLARLGAGDPEGGRADLEAVVRALPAGQPARPVGRGPPRRPPSPTRPTTPTGPTTSAAPRPRRHPSPGSDNPNR